MGPVAIGFCLTFFVSSACFFFPLGERAVSSLGACYKRESLLRQNLQETSRYSNPSIEG